MHKHWLMALLSGLLIGATGCPDVDEDPNEVGTAGPQVEFDPSARIIPFPNNLLIDPMTGLVNLPAQCNESAASKATREQVLNQLDGFGTYETAITVTFTEPVDEATLADRVVLYQRTSGANALDPAASQEVPVLVRRTQTTRFAADCATSSMVEQVAIIPLVPLEQKSNYTVALLSGIKTQGGADFGPSFTWALINQAEPPVAFDDQGNLIVNRTPLNPLDPEDFASLQGIALLWRAHAQALGFLEAKGHARGDVLLAWEFKTQTTTDPLDPAVAGSPAAGVLKAPLQGLTSLPGFNRAMPPWVLCDPAGGGPGTDSDVQCFLKISFGGAAGVPANQVYAAGDATCAQVGCAAVGDVLGGAFGSKQYQIDTPNPFDASKPIPGPWNNPRTPTSTKTETIGVLVFVPAATAPTDGFPTIVFGHGLGSSRTSVLAIGPQLAAPRAALGFSSGFVTVSMDFVAHGSRAVRISNTGACADTGTPAAPPSPSAAPQCYAPFLSPNLAATRDNIRQSVLDMQGLVEAVKACGTAACTTPNANLKIDPTQISYAGISLGGIIGSMVVATKTELTASLLNVAGAGWFDILENTETLEIRCSLVDALIDAGVLVGDKSTGAMPLCLGETWKTQPGYRQFAAIGRWVIDPADPANFTRKLIGRAILIQEVVGDLVVPNIATNNLGALVQLTPMAADPATSATPPPSDAILDPSSTAKFLTYTDTAGPPPNDFEHASLLRPAPTPGGPLGTIRLQVDAITYLILNR